MCWYTIHPVLWGWPARLYGCIAESMVVFDVEVYIIEALDWILGPLKCIASKHGQLYCVVVSEQCSI